ncbi:MAG: TRIC cation channel family protein [Cyanobacteria bacterium P01_H01_bin.119]
MVHGIALVVTAVFSITGVLAAARKSMDLFSVTVIGIVTALGGGTIRDVLMDAPVFWLHRTVYLCVALGAAVATFWGARLFQSTYRLWTPRCSHSLETSGALVVNLRNKVKL